MRITSTRNPVIKHVRSLERAPFRREQGVYLAEGLRLVTEALESNQPATLALYDPELLKRSAAGSFLVARLPDWAERSYEVDSRVLTAAAQTEHPSGVLVVLRSPKPPPLSSQAGSRFGVVLDRLADPGNAGTILRTADAAGVGFVVALPGTVDLSAPKVVRAGMGAHFRLALYQNISWDELIAALPDFEAIALEAGAGDSIYGISWPEHSMLVVGSEAHGVSTGIEKVITRKIHIPMRGAVESLNAAVAASVAIYSALGPTIS